MFTYKQQPEITPGLADRAHIFARLTHNIEKWQRELDRGETPTQDSTGADIPNNLQVTQEVLEGLKHEAFGIYDAELRMKPRTKALAEDAIQKDLPNAAEALVVLDYALHPAKREAEIKAQNEVLAKREADRMAIQEKILQEKREKEAKRLPNRVRSWIKKGWHLVKGEKTEKAQAQIPQTKEVQEAVVLGTDGQEIKKITSIDQASESASAFFQDLMEKDL